MPSCTHPKRYYQPVENHHPLLPWDITFYRIMQFDWLTAFWPITRDPEFCQMWDWWWNINSNIIFHSRLLPRKTNGKNFQKNKKKHILGPFWSLFVQIWQKLAFLEKRLRQFLNIRIIYLPSRQKSEKNNVSFLRKILNWWMHRQTDGQTMVIS